MESPEEKLDKYRNACREQAVHCYGTAAILTERARNLKVRLRLLAFLGFGTPLVVGAIILAFGSDGAWVSWLIGFAAVLGIIQVVTSLWALVAGWDDAFAYAKESLASNNRLANDFIQLATNPPPGLDEFYRRMDRCMVVAGERSPMDDNQHFSECEKRYGMRAGLRQVQIPCISCKMIPTSMDSTDCDVCGRFQKTKFLGIQTRKEKQ